MSIIVVGLGSMGRRRIRLLQNKMNIYNIIGIDIKKERRIKAQEDFHIKTASSFEETIKTVNADIVFVCTSPNSHSTLIQKALESNHHVFTEINVVSDGYDENIELSNEKNKVLFISSTMLYRKEIQAIRRIALQDMQVKSYLYHVGQYLPDWHPWENYSDYFVADNRTNACREIMAIEFPWLIDIWGDISSVQVQHSKLTELSIDYPDCYQIIVKHQSGTIGLIQIDAVSRKAVRKLELLGERCYLSWNGTYDSLVVYDFQKKEDINICVYNDVDQQKEYNATIIENAYEDEIRHFFDVIVGKSKQKYTFSQDKQTLSLIDIIEERNNV